MIDLAAALITIPQVWSMSIAVRHIGAAFFAKGIEHTAARATFVTLHQYIGSLTGRAKLEQPQRPGTGICSLVDELDPGKIVYVTVRTGDNKASGNNSG